MTTGEIWALPVMLRWSILSVLAQAAGQITGLVPQDHRSRAEDALLIPPLSGSLSDDEVVANCFTSLRTIATYDWRDFFESVSRVEQVLRTDPAGCIRPHGPRHPRSVSQGDRRTGSGERSERAGRRACSGRAGAKEPGWTCYLPGSSPSRSRIRQMLPLGRVWTCLQLHTWATICWTMAARTLEDRVGYRPSPAEAAGALGTEASRRGLHWSDRAADAADAGRIRPLRRRSRRFRTLVLLAVAVTFLPALAAAMALVDWVVTLAVPPRILPKLNLANSRASESSPTHVAHWWWCPRF